MRKCELDIKMSKEVYDYFNDVIKLKECYNNTFNVFTLCPKSFREGKWKVAYGYVKAMDGLYCRHCFILNAENGKVIDPTIFAQSDPKVEREYYLMSAFDNTEEYLNAIEENDYMPALDKYFREQDIEAQKWAKENGYIFIG